MDDESKVAPSGTPLGHAKLRVFISYSREDIDFADQLEAGLKVSGFEPTMKVRLGALILDAETIVFVLSPASARSPICQWEVAEAVRLGKRIIPVPCKPIDGTVPPPELAGRNYIFFYAEPKLPGSGFGTGLGQLVSALNTDRDWLREHTRLLLRATEWRAGDWAENRLLSGSDIAAAKAWAARRPKDAPEPTDLHLEFIRASEEAEDARLSSQRKQLEEIAEAQGEREKALAQAEVALKQAAEAQRRRTRIRNIAFVLVSIAFVVVCFLASMAAWLTLQTRSARLNAEQARLEVQQAEEDSLRRESRNFRDEVDRWKKVEDRLTRAANLGSIDGMLRLGEAYEYDQANNKAAILWYVRASARGDAQAMIKLGSLYELGLGVEQDEGKARDWYEKAIATGDRVNIR
jgi:hypothetical protein